MSIIFELGYLDTAYLSYPAYLAGVIGEGTGSQVSMFIDDEADDPETGLQIDMITSEFAPIGDQINMKVFTDKNTGVQTLMFIDDEADDEETGLQVQMQIAPEISQGMEILAGTLTHIVCGGYLTNSYLIDAYLAYRFCALQGMQIEQFIVSEADDEFTGVQIDQKIISDKSLGAQVLMRVYDEKEIGMQVNRLKALKVGTQLTMVIYNISQLRILCAFDSRGTAALGGNNWTSPQGTDTGDFGLSNLNTDVLEQRTQSPVGVTALWELRCNTGNPNTFVDTIAILEHNFTKSASVTVQGSDDPAFGSIKFSFVMVTELSRMFYIAPTLPNIPAQYYRFLIEDFTNPDGQLKIGTIVFGSSQIFTLRENFSNPVGFGKKHFKDSLNTEGFTNVSNDRATRKFLQLKFEELDVSKGNYQLIQNYLTDAKTDLKCLVIPTPERPSILAVFAKLVQLPDESHNATDVITNHFVELSLDWDESL